MLDIDGWLMSGANGVAAFPKTREFFWEMVAESNREGGGGGGVCRGLCQDDAHLSKKSKKGAIFLGAPYRSSF
jgi:hypothetical protein